MKHILLAFLILLAFPVFGQNYRTVLVDKEVYFDFSESNNSFGGNPNFNASRIIHADSFQVVNNDTIVRHRFNQEFEQKETPFDTINYNAFCFYPIDTGFMGYKTILKSNGIDVFFNRFEDSIFINTQANLNDTWIFYESSDVLYEAKVIDVKSETFLGISDMVKTIHLQAKDSLGNNISTIYDTLDIKISQSHGLIEGFYFFKFPYATTPNYPYNAYKKIKIIGIPHLGLGVDNLTAADVFDFNVGDEFHRLEISEGSGNGGNPGGLLCQDRDYQLIKIKGKQFSNNGDSVFYDIHLQHYLSDCDIDFPPISSTTVFDTIFIGDTTIVFDISNNNYLNTKTLYRDADSTLWVQSFDGQRKYITGLNTIEWNASGCYPYSLSPQTFYNAVFQKGVGLSSWGSYSLWGSEIGELVYSKIKGVEWGTPLNIDSLSTISTDEIVKTNFNLKVFPNPTNNLLNFELETPQKNTEIRLFSTLGQELKRIYFDNENYQQIDVSAWNSGVYFYGVLVEGVLVKQGQILVEH